MIVKLHLRKLVHTDLTVTKYTLNIPRVFVVEKYFCLNSYVEVQTKFQVKNSYLPVLN